MLGIFNWIYNFIYSLFQKFFPHKSQKVILSGLDRAGKQSLLYNLKNDHEGQEIINCLEIVTNDIDEKINDQNDISKIYRDCQGIVFMIDASDQCRFDNAKKCLHNIINLPVISKIPILILANKIDVAGSASYSDIFSEFELKDVSNIRPVKLFMTSIIQHFGYINGFKWLYSNISFKK